MITVLYLLSIRQQFEATAWMIVVWWVLLIVAASIATLIATFLAFRWHDLSLKERWGCCFAALTT